MKTQDEELLEILHNLLREEDILATMIARKGMAGTSPDSQEFKIKDIGVWNTLQNTMNGFFEIIAQFSNEGLDRIYFELGEYEVVFFVVVSDIALVCIIPALANRGLIDVEMENSRRKIREILKV